MSARLVSEVKVSTFKDHISNMSEKCIVCKKYMYEGAREYSNHKFGDTYCMKDSPGSYWNKIDGQVKV